MTISGTDTTSGHARLLEKLLGAVRPEFRVDILVPNPDDPVLGYKLCIVDGCDRPQHEHGICTGHSPRWRQRGCPDLTEFLADPGPPLRGRIELDSCTVPGCRYGINSRRLCTRHGGRWRRAGYPDFDAWITTVPVFDVIAHDECALSFCTLWVENDRTIFCTSHTTRWRGLGLDTKEFIAHCEHRGLPVIDFRALPAQMRLELQYAVQHRHDQQQAVAPPDVLRLLVRQLAESGASSLLERSEEQWRAWCERPLGGRDRRPKRADSLLLYARETVESLRDGSGWEVEYRRDVWRIWMLPGLKISIDRTRPRSHLRFDRVTQPWLRDLGKRWVRWRLVSGLSVETAATDVQALTRFSEFLTAAVPDVEALADVDRPLLERYLAWLQGQPGSARGIGSRVGSLQLFFQAIRQYGWDDSLPTTAAFFTGDYPRRRHQHVTRHLAEYVMAQVEHPDNLDRWHYPEGRLVTTILIRCGLRVSDACTLQFDCLLHDGQQAPYLRYYNNKMQREAAVPIDAELEAEIRDQQRRVLDRWPGGSPNLFPRPTANTDGRHPLLSRSYRGMLNRWLETCDIHDEHGRPVHLTPHQWRHTFATRLINRDVPLEVIRVLLDHETSHMTSHYAKITDTTVRRRWQQATKVNVKGERVELGPDGPLAQAQWAKTRYGMATQTLPNGYCGLPLQRSCPHANACLTCPVFVTGPEFLPELREQRRRTLTLIDVSEGNGNTRVVEMNKQVAANLDRIISEVEKDEDVADAR
ncbi:tyrosine-type recombinase/integrase [Rhodococcus wratislaviensis]|uniref:tyrosine-type recombinase/integrase n=1 Tax=Rhodococcus wratislaviensis TaxID=44752 RepID=UPI0035127D81